MAEGVEEAENNNNSSNCEGSVMIGAVMPSLASSVNFGAIKKELESACVTSHIHHSPSSDSRDRHQRELKEVCTSSSFSISYYYYINICNLFNLKQQKYIDILHTIFSVYIISDL